MPARLKQLKKEHIRTSSPSDLLAELHVYIVPVDKWIPFRRLARNTVIDETVSAGFVRVPPMSTLLELRGHLLNQLEFDIPDHFVFIKCVGRNFTQVKGQQEQMVKVKNFLPPQAVEPEIHILEVSEDLINKSGSVPNLLLSDTELSDNAGFGTARTGSYRLSQRDDAQNSSSLGLPKGVQDLESIVGHTNFQTEREQLVPQDTLNIITLDYKVGGQNETANHISSIKTKNRIKGERSKSTGAHNKGESKDDHPNNHDRKKPTNRNTRLPKRNTSKSVPSSKYSQNRQESPGEDINGEMEEKSDSFSDSFSMPHRNNIKKATSLTVLNRSSSQESLTENGSERSLKNMHRNRSRKITRQNENNKRSASVSGMNRNRGAVGEASPEEVKTRRSYSEDRSMYHPHKWTIRREAENPTENSGYNDDEFEEVSVVKTKSKRAKQLLAEHEAAREELRHQEAKKFEEQIRKEEEMSHKKDFSNNKTEILNLEGSNSLHEVYEVVATKNLKSRKQSQPLKSAKAADSAKFKPDFDQNGFEITYEVEVDNEVIDKSKTIKVKKKSVTQNQPKKSAWEESAQERKKSHKKTKSVAPQNIPEEDFSKAEERDVAVRPLRTANYTANSRKNFKTFAFENKNVEATLQEVLKEKTAYIDERAELFTKARILHEEILAIKEKRLQKWWDEYNLARRKGTRLEERQGNLRQELEGLYRRVIGSLMRKEPFVTGVKGGPSRKASYKISVIRLRHEISDLIRRVEAIDIKLEAETRLRQQAEQEVKLLRSEVSRKKANVALSQSRAPHLRNIAYIPEDILIRL